MDNVKEATDRMTDLPPAPGASGQTERPGGQVRPRWQPARPLGKGILVRGAYT